MQQLVADEIRQLIAQPLFLGSQLAVDQQRVRGLEPRPQERCRRAGTLGIEPTDLQAQLPANALETFEGQRQLALADRLGRTFDIGEIIVMGLLPDADQELCELPARSAGL